MATHPTLLLATLDDVLRHSGLASLCLQDRGVARKLMGDGWYKKCVPSNLLHSTWALGSGKTNSEEEMRTFHTQPDPSTCPSGWSICGSQQTSGV